MNNLKIILCTVLVLLHFFLRAQPTIKDYYKQFPYKFFEEEKLQGGADTICDKKNAYLHIQSKPNDAWSEYITFTYFKTTSGNKVFAVERGFSTTASDQFHIAFYTNRKNKWKNVTTKVFPYSFTFKDFWIGKIMPPKRFHKFNIHIEIPPKGTYLIAHIIGISEDRKDELHLNEKDLEMYDTFFDTNNNHYFRDIIFPWNAKEEIFMRK